MIDFSHRAVTMIDTDGFEQDVRHVINGFDSYFPVITVSYDSYWATFVIPSQYHDGLTRYRDFHYKDQTVVVGSVFFL